MKLAKLRKCGSKRGMALVIVLVLGGVAIAIVGGVLNWTSANARLINRNIAYQNAVLAAEAATEKTLSKMAADFTTEGAVVLGNNMPSYKRRVPLVSEHPKWGFYRFNNGRGARDEVFVEMIQPWAPNTPLLSLYRGLKGYAATFRIRANAEDVVANAEAGVYQDVQFAVVPVFQFAVFYNIDLEVLPGANMTIRGRVHSNRDLYAAPEQGAQLQFDDWVTSVGTIYHYRKDNPSRSMGVPSYKVGREQGVSALNLPIGTNNSPDAVRELLEVPRSGSANNSVLESQRFYNLCDVVVEVTTDRVSVRGGSMSPGTGANIPWQEASSWINTNKTFFDQRENKTVLLTEINVFKFWEWATNKNAIRNHIQAKQNREINSIYVADLRPHTSSTMPAVRLVNGAVLPPSGLTVVTPNPLYVQGHYNASGASLGTTNTANTKPAALIADAITVLSTGWNDSNSAKDLSSRIASDTTVNAAFLAGIVETVGTNYSGGLENFPRFLENWSGKTFTYNGSMVVMFPSKVATNRWKAPGTQGNVYGVPTRNWSFDVNFTDPNKLPPLCPAVRAVIRYKWATVAPTAS
ncbi:MAG: hypothetical protein RMH97_06125 [Verrucomicrobiales bacterium]|nr:hypothetical protein [Verrucomicrobiales bacterium]